MIRDKIIPRKTLVSICDEFRAEDKIIGFTSGAFDILHAGHVDYLEKAKSLCDKLIVGLNSDDSIQNYKGANRPLISELQRQKTIAALESVDYVFLFDERRNASNIELLKPDFYFKAGDYEQSQLTSKQIVEGIGGTVIIIPVVEKISTTDIINRIALNGKFENDFVEEQKNSVHLKRKTSRSSPAIFLDRDGTINREIGYLSDPDDFELLPHALEGMKKFQDMGYRLVIITNQGGIGLGYFTKQDFYRVNKKMLTEVSRSGILIDKIYFCPHSKAENCPCRKPETGLVVRAREELNIDLKNSFFIGDSPWDIEAGAREKMHTIFIKNDRIQPEQYENRPEFMAEDLLDAANYVFEQERIVKE
jgi:D-glycero-D-manno-heptose 1,7-bisphosphate phosphatase